MTPLYLLDTNIILEISKLNPNENVIQKIIENKNLSCISSITLEELLFGAKREKTEKLHDALLSFVIDYVQGNFEIIPYDLHCSWINSDIREKMEHLDTKIPLADSMTASIAIANNMVLVTRNTKDFKAIQEVSSLKIENWFEP